MARGACERRFIEQATDDFQQFAAQVAATSWDDIVALDVEGLLELRERVDAEVRRRLEVAEAQVDRLRSAVALAAAARERAA